MCVRVLYCCLTLVSQSVIWIEADSAMRAEGAVPQPLSRNEIACSELGRWP
jgi:hypothetical protein